MLPQYCDLVRAYTKKVNHITPHKRKAYTFHCVCVYALTTSQSYVKITFDTSNIWII